MPAGAIVDRIDRRQLMIGCDIASALAMATLVTVVCLIFVALLTRFRRRELQNPAAAATP